MKKKTTKTTTKARKKPLGALDIPADYVRFHDAGLTSNDRRKGIVLSEFRWLTPQQIGKWDFDVPLAHRFVPFAATPSHDAYCWWHPSKAGPAAAIVSSPHDCEEAEVVCETFDQFLAWALLQEARSTDLPNQLQIQKQEVAPLLTDYVSRLEGFLPSKATDTLRGLFSKSPKGLKEERAVITKDQYNMALEQLVRFERRGEAFEQYAE